MKGSLGEAIPSLLNARGIDTIFGIPGVHTVELYRGLARSKLTHITPRHEQGAGFMADGYARATGRPAACFVVTGPGLLNIATAMGQALADSIPMLVIATLNPRVTLERGEGRLHELRGQSRLGRELAALSHTILDKEQFIPALDDAFALFASMRPGPVLIEIPIDLLSEPFTAPPVTPHFPRPPRPNLEQVIVVADMLNKAKTPLVFLGGGAVRGAAAVRALVDKLQAPTLATSNAKGILPANHSFLAGGCLLTPPLIDAIKKADVILAIGTELGETDFGYDEKGLQLSGTLIRVDIDAYQLSRNAQASVPILSEAGAFAEVLLPLIARQTDSGIERAKAMLEAGLNGIDPRYLKHKPLLDKLWVVLPDAIVVGDSTALSYAGNHMASPPAPRRWMSAASGFGTLGYGLPAAIGAKIGKPDSPVICLTGDGGLHYTMPELAAAMDAKTPITVLLWNDHKYGEIEHYMKVVAVEPVGVDLYPTDFAAAAKAFGAVYQTADNLDEVTQAIQDASKRAVSTIVEMKADRYVSG